MGCIYIYIYKYYITHADHARPRRAKRTYKVSYDEEWSLFHIFIYYIVWTLVGIGSRAAILLIHRGTGAVAARSTLHLDVPYGLMQPVLPIHIILYSYYTPILILS